MVKIDIDMPKSCADCTIRKIMGCRIANESVWLSNRRDERCLLKSDEPRVMTIEEVTHSEDWLWYEIRNVYQGWVKMNDCDEEWIDWEDCTIDRLSTYGVQWRCWTSRPSAELMASTPWGGDAE